LAREEREKCSLGGRGFRLEHGFSGIEAQLSPLDRELLKVLANTTKFSRRQELAEKGDLSFNEG